MLAEMFPSPPLYNDYSMEYLVYRVSGSLQEEMQNWDIPLYNIYQRLMFKKFENWCEYKMNKNGR